MMGGIPAVPALIGLFSIPQVLSLIGKSIERASSKEKMDCLLYTSRCV